jgi:hypothetical protein
VKIEDFWALIQGSSTATKSQRERTEWLTGHLARLPVPAITEFELHLTAQRKHADTRLMWGAAWIIMQGWCSDDGFFYFQPWLVGLGHQTFEQVAGNPTPLPVSRRSTAWPAAGDRTGPTTNGPSGNSSTTSHAMPMNVQPAKKTGSTTPWKHKVSTASATPPPKTTPGTTTIPVRDSRGSRA